MMREPEVMRELGKDTSHGAFRAPVKLGHRSAASSPCQPGFTSTASLTKQNRASGPAKGILSNKVTIRQKSCRIVGLCHFNVFVCLDFTPFYVVLIVFCSCFSLGWGWIYSSLFQCVIVIASNSLLFVLPI